MTAAWKLIIEDDAGKQIIVPFAKDVITIGRKEGNTIRLTERNVSRFHCKLQKENGHVLVEDLGSYNGIRLNGDRIAGRVAVNEGDTIQIGDYHLAFHAAEGAGVARAGGAPPQHASAGLDGHVTRDDDEFAGDTQRWEPPNDMSPLAVGGLQTQEELPRPPISEETARSPINHVAPLDTQEGGFLTEPTQQQTERYPSPSNPGGPPTLEQVPSRRAFTGNLEPTVRQAAAPAPVSGVGVPGAAAAMAAAQETRPERPLPGPVAQVPPPVVQPPASSPALMRPPTTSSVKLSATQVPTEQTEAVRPAPIAGEDVTAPRLFIVSTVFCGSAYRVSQPEMVIGRTEENDITIEHRSVSRNHAKIVREGDRVRIMDLKSANGVLVNGEEIETAVLRPGDIIELGRVKIRYVPIGERFTVTPEEIERARIADVANEEFEGEGSTGITNPVRPRAPVTAAVEPEPRSKMMFAAIGAVIVVLGVIAVVALTRSGSKEDEGEPSPPPVAVKDPPKVPPPVVPPPVDPAPPPVDVKPVDTPPADLQPVDTQPDPAPVDTVDDPPNAQPSDTKPRNNKKPDKAVDIAKVTKEFEGNLDAAAKLYVFKQDKAGCRAELKKASAIKKHVTVDKLLKRFKDQSEQCRE